MENKEYIKCSFTDNSNIFRGYYEDMTISDDILSRLARDLGFSFDMYSALSSIDQSAADKFVESLSRKNNHLDIYLLVDHNTKEVLGYSLDSTRVPILNTEFIKRVKSLAETSSDIKVVETYCASDDTISSVLLKKVEPVSLESISNYKESYNIGILVVNNELDSVYCRMVVYVEDQPIYLPASFYNVTTNRYKKSTGNSEEALEVLILKIIDDLREDELKYKVQEFHRSYKINKDILATYEEYTTVLRSMMKIPSIIDDRSILESVNARIEDFEKRYNKLEDQKSSYIWRCTAIGDLTIGGLIHLVSLVLRDLNAPVIEYFSVRELIGSYLSTRRIASEIAKEDL